MSAVTSAYLSALRELHREAMKDEWALPWDRQGSTIFAGGTRKRLCEIPIAHKTSAEMNALTGYIYAAAHAVPRLVEEIERLRGAMRQLPFGVEALAHLEQVASDEVEEQVRSEPASGANT